MTLEIGIELKAIRMAEAEGCILKKIGMEGWPDRLLLLGSGRHVWIEFKRPGEQLRAAQKRIIERLQRIGDEVHVLTEAEPILDIIHDDRVGA